MMNKKNKANVKFIGFKTMGEWSVAELQTFASQQHLQNIQRFLSVEFEGENRG